MQTPFHNVFGGGASTPVDIHEKFDSRKYLWDSELSINQTNVKNAAPHHHIKRSNNNNINNNINNSSNNSINNINNSNNNNNNKTFYSDLVNTYSNSCIQGTSEKIDCENGEKEISEWNEVASAEAAFIGPHLWEKPLHCSTELKVCSNLHKMELLDLDDFLKENDIDEDLLNQSFKAETSETFKNGLFDGVPSSERTSADAGSTINGERESRQISPSLSFEGYQESETSSEASGSSYANEKKYWMSNSNQQDEFETPSKSLRKHSSKSSKDYSSCKHPNEKRSKFSSRPSSCNSIDYPPSLLGEEGFDPRTRVFSDDELKPQQMIKKSKKKQLVPSDLKDEKYWARRQKNNVAAKRSRDARRTKENQIAMRARYLEKENQNLKMELQDTLLKLETMKRRLSEYETP